MSLNRVTYNPNFCKYPLAEVETPAKVKGKGSTMQGYDRNMNRGR